MAVPCKVAGVAVAAAVGAARAARSVLAQQGRLGAVLLGALAALVTTVQPLLGYPMWTGAAALLVARWAARRLLPVHPAVAGAAGHPMV